MDPALLQYLPAIEERITRKESEWQGPTVGLPTRRIFKGSNDKTSHVAGGSPEQEEEIKSSTVNVEGRTSSAGNGVVESQGVKAAEDRPHLEKQHTVAFSEYLFTRKTVELVALLTELKANLQKAEGAAIMTSFRRSLEEIWNVAGRLPKEKILIVSAVEEAVRNKKWRELSVGQVEVVQRLLTDVNTVADGSKADLDKAFRAIHKSQIDIYPCAGDEFDEEAEGDYDEE